MRWNRRRQPQQTEGFQDAVVFSGGGNAGAAQVGMIQALLEAGVEPDLFVGCSVGALNAAYMAMNPTISQAHDLEAIWRAVGRGNVLGGTRRSVAAHIIRHDDHLYEPNGLRALIAGAVPVADLADLPVPVHVVTTDLSLGETAWWSSGDPVEILTASASLPGMFPPVRLGTGLHVDGGVLCPVPVGRALAVGARRVWVLDVCSKRSQLSTNPSALDVLLASFSVTRRALQTHTETRPRDDQRVTVIECDLPADFDVRDFSHTAELIAAGRTAGQLATQEENQAAA